MNHANRSEKAKKIHQDLNRWQSEVPFPAKQCLKDSRNLVLYLIV